MMLILIVLKTKYHIMLSERNEILELKIYVQLSKYRERTLKAIGNEIKVPSTIANDSNIRINHISNVLRQLKNKNIVECMNEDAHKGRLYRLTPTGKEILKSIEKDEKKINSN